MSVAETLLLVAAGGAVGGVLRALVTTALDRGGVPWGTLFVNVTGSGAAGLGAALLMGEGANPAPAPVWALLGIGVLGSYTTVSAFALQAHGLAIGGRSRAALGYVLGSLGLCLLASAAGFAAASAGSG